MALKHNVPMQTPASVPVATSWLLAWGSLRHNAKFQGTHGTLFAFHPQLKVKQNKEHKKSLEIQSKAKQQDLKMLS